MVPRYGRLGSILLAIIIFFTLSSSLAASDIHPAAVGGVLDLRNCDFNECGVVSLDGQWAFHWDTLFSDFGYAGLLGKQPDHYVDVPSYWDGLADVDDSIRSHGTATYFLEVLLPQTDELLALKFLNITPNGEIYVNGVKSAAVGTVSSDPNISESGNQPIVIPLSCTGEMLTIAVSISNFHNIAGGLNRPVQIGRYVDIRRVRERRLIFDAIFLGGLLLMGLYQITLFLLTPKRIAPLFLSLLCLLAFAFSGLKHELALLGLFPSWDGEVRSKIIFISLALAPLAYASYARHLYPAHFKRWMIWVISGISLAFAVFIGITPKAIFTRLMIILEVILILDMVYVIIKLFIGYFRSKDRQILYTLGGLLFLVGGMAFGIADNEEAMSFQSVAGVFFVFVLYQAFLQAYIYSYAFREIDFLNRQKSQLEKRNVELFSLSYIDSLTGTCNRRLMDDYLASNWRVSALSEKTLGLILIDIDEFKGYNEFYGHRQGDVCLMKVAELIRERTSEAGQDTLARYGGEEFALIVSDTDADKLYDLAESLRTAVESAGIENRASTVSDRVTISLGCAAVMPSMDEDPETLLDEASKALSRAKNAGRNRTESTGSDQGGYSWEPRLV